MKIGVMFGSPETTTGGNALKFYASRPPRHPPHRRDQGGGRRGRQKDPAVVGNRTRVKVVKNKMAPPFREVEFDILYGQGISPLGRRHRSRAPSSDIVEKSGAWFSFGGERIGQGRENAKAYLEQHPEVHGQARGDDPRQARHQARRRTRRTAAPNGAAHRRVGRPARPATEAKPRKRVRPRPD